MHLKQQKTELTVPHRGETLTLTHPFLGPNSYHELKQEANSRGERMATIPEAASIAYGAFVTDKENNCSREIQKTMRNKLFYAATKSLWLPNEGVYTFPDDGSIELPEVIRDRMGTLNLGELELFLGVLEKHRDLVGFAKLRIFDLPELSSSLQFEKDPYVRALAGQEGAEKLAEVSAKHRIKKPYIWAHQNVDKPLVTVACFGSGRFGSNYGYGFGVRETSVAS